MKDFRRILHGLFIPSHRNNHHPHAISHGALTVYLVAAVASFVVLRNIGIQTGNVLGFATDVSVDRVLSLTNEQRLQSGLPALTYSQELSQAAAAKAQDMFGKGYWAHFGPSGESPWNFILGAGYQYEYAGENLAKNFMDSGSLVNAWMSSTTHRDNILNGNYKEIGIAVVNGNLSGEDTTLVVQMFGSRSQLPVATTVTEQETQGSGIVAENIPVVTVTPATEDGPFDSEDRLVLVKSETSPIPSNEPETVETITLPAPAKTSSPTLNLLPAFRLIASIAIVILIIIFLIDFYHITRSQFHSHRGKHIAHLIFLIAMLVAIYFLGRGAIL